MDRAEMAKMSLEEIFFSDTMWVHRVFLGVTFL